VWRKQADSAWKVELDIGIGHDRVARPDKVESPPLPKPVSRGSEINKYRMALANADQDASGSLLKYLASDVRLYRDGSLPIIGKGAAQDWLSKNSTGPETQQVDVKIAKAADLGYTYGTSPTANYLRIWKKERDGSWKIILDLLMPVPGNG
jgi:ketosteroid isomerase-like protein